MNHTMPVSYTHLDVYKRQVIVRANAVTENQRFPWPHSQGFGNMMAIGSREDSAFLRNIINKESWHDDSPL